MMSPAESFLKFYETCRDTKETLSFNDFFKQEFQDFKTPIKYSVKYNDSIEEQAECICCAILKNLHLNSFFKELSKSDLPIKLVKDFYDLFQDAIFKKELDGNQIAQLILYLHMSKSNFDTTNFKLNFFEISSVYICNDQMKDYDLRFVNQLNELFEKLIQNNKLQRISEEVVKKISSETSSFNYEFKKLKLVYFISNINGINGFSGIDKIYVSINELTKLYGSVFKILKENDRLVISKLNFIRLIQHEQTHVLLRSSLNNVNVSSPMLINQGNVRANDPLEAGLLAEISHFKARINWKLSTYQDKFNLNYCFSYVESIESNKDVEFEIAKLVNFIEYEDKPVVMACDFIYPEKDLCFE